MMKYLYHRIIAIVLCLDVSDWVRGLEGKVIGLCFFGGDAIEFRWLDGGVDYFFIKFSHWKFHLRTFFG